MFGLVFVCFRPSPLWVGAVDRRPVDVRVVGPLVRYPWDLNSAGEKEGLLIPAFRMEKAR